MTMTAGNGKGSSNGETLLQFPCDIDIKAMGRHTEAFPEVVLGLIREHAPEVTRESLSTRASRDSTYLSVTVNMTASSRAQLDAIYTALSEHPAVLMAL